MRNFLFAINGDVPVGMIGIEQYDDIGLLRSLVVDESCRGAGVGHQLVVALESMAAEQSVRELWLLTIDADGYFAGLGYVVKHRSDAPESISATEEFSSLCPGDAVLMKKDL